MATPGFQAGEGTPLHLPQDVGVIRQYVPSRYLIVVVLTRRATDATGMPAVCDDVLAVVRATG